MGGTWHLVAYSCLQSCEQGLWEQLLCCAAQDAHTGSQDRASPFKTGLDIKMPKQEKTWAPASQLSGNLTDWVQGVMLQCCLFPVVLVKCFPLVRWIWVGWIPCSYTSFSFAMTFVKLWVFVGRRAYPLLTFFFLLFWHTCEEIGLSFQNCFQKSDFFFGGWKFSLKMITFGSGSQKGDRGTHWVVFFFFHVWKAFLYNELRVESELSPKVYSKTPSDLSMCHSKQLPNYRG